MRGRPGLSLFLSLAVGAGCVRPAVRGSSAEPAADAGTEAAFKLPPYAVAAVLPPLKRRFGIETGDQLRTALILALENKDKAAAGLVAWVGDRPTQLAIIQQALHDNPADVSAISAKAETLLALGRYEDAVQEVDACLLRYLQTKDARASKASPYAALLRTRCRAQRILGRLEEAIESCQEAAAVATNEASAPRTLAKLLLISRHPDEALRRVQASVDLDPKDASSWYTLGWAQALLKNDKEAQSAWRQSLLLAPDNFCAQASIAKSIRTAPDAFACEGRWQTEHDVRYFLLCAHVYWDLGLLGPAEACADEGARFAAPLVATERLRHLAETDGVAALSRARAALSPTADRSLLELTADLELRAGHPDPARTLLDRALVLDARSKRANDIYVRVCEALQDPGCADQHRAVLRGELPGKPDAGT